MARGQVVRIPCLPALGQDLLASCWGQGVPRSAEEVEATSGASLAAGVPIGGHRGPGWAGVGPPYCALTCQVRPTLRLQVRGQWWAQACLHWGSCRGTQGGGAEEGPTEVVGLFEVGMYLLRFSCWFWGAGDTGVRTAPIATHPGCCVPVQGVLPPQFQAVPQRSQVGMGWNGARLCPSVCGCRQGWAGEAQPHSGPTELSLASCRAPWGGPVGGPRGATWGRGQALAHSLLLPLPFLGEGRLHAASWLAPVRADVGPTSRRT